MIKGGFIVEKLIVILVKYGWLLFIFIMSSIAYILNDGSEDMFTSGVIALCTFLILTKLERLEK